MISDAPVLSQSSARWLPRLAVFLFAVFAVNFAFAQPYNTSGQIQPSSTGYVSNGQGAGSPAYTSMNVGWSTGMYFTNTNAFTVYANVFFTGSSSYSYVRYVQYSVDGGPRVNVFWNPGGGWGGWSAEYGEWRVFPISITPINGSHTVIIYAANGYTGGEAAAGFSYTGSMNVAPTVELTLPPPSPIPANGYYHVRATGYDSNNNLGGVQLEYSKNGSSTWNAIAYDVAPANSGSFTTNYNGVTFGVEGDYYQFRFNAYDTGGLSTGWQYSGYYYVNHAPTVILTANGLASSVGGQTTSASVALNTTVNFTSSAGDSDGNYSATRTWVNFNGQGWVLVRNDANSNYGWSYMLNAAGTYQFHSRSVDATGTESATAIINITTTNTASGISITANGVGTANIYYGQTATISATGTDADGNLYNVDWMRYDGSTYYRPGNADYSRIGWNGYGADAGYYTSQNFTNDAASGFGPVTKSAVFVPPSAGTFNFLGYAGDGIGNWGAWAYVVVARTTPTINASNKSWTGTRTLVAGDFDATATNPYNSASLSVSGYYRWNGSAWVAMGVGTVLLPGTYSVRIDRSADGNYEYAYKDVTWTVGNVAPTASLSIKGATSGTVTGVIGEVLTITLSGSDTDGNLRAVNLWVYTPSTAWRNIRSDNTINGGFIENGTTDNAVNSGGSNVSTLGPVNRTFTIPLSEGFGTYTFVVRSIDASGTTSTSQQVAVSVSNRAPNAPTLTLDRSTAAIGDVVTISMTISDPDGNLDYTNLWVSTPTLGWRWIHADNSLATGGALDRSHSSTAYGASGTFTRSFTFTLAQGIGTYTFALATVDTSGARTDSPNRTVTVSNRAPSARIRALSTSINFGQSMTLYTDGADADGNLTYLTAYIRGPGTYANGDWTGWTLINSSTFAAAASNTLTTTWTPTAAGNWQFHGNAADAMNAYAHGSTSNFVTWNTWINGNDVLAANFTVNAATPVGTFAGPVIYYAAASGGYTVQSANFTATFANPYTATVAAPTGAVTYSIPATGTTVTAGTVLPKGTYVVRATIAPTTNYSTSYVDCTWTIRDPILTVNASGPGSATGGGSFPMGSTPIVTASANSGAVFIGWSGPVSNSYVSPTTVPLTQDTTVTANFTTGTPAGTVDFGSAYLPNTYQQTPMSTVRTATIANGGNSALNITGIYSAGDFAPAQSTGFSVTPGSSKGVVVTFRPTSAGLRTGTIAIPSNDALKPLLVYTVTGTGLTPVYLPPTVSAERVGAGNIFTGDSLPFTLKGVSPMNSLAKVGYMVTQPDGSQVGPFFYAPGGTSAAINHVFSATIGSAVGTYTILGYAEDADGQNSGWIPVLTFGATIGTYTQEISTYAEPKPGLEIWFTPSPVNTAVYTVQKPR